MTSHSLTSHSLLRLSIAGATAIVAALWSPVSFAQTSPSTTFDASTSSKDIFDTSGQDLNPLSIINKINLSKEDPFSFFQRQQDNLNSEVSNFRTRQLDQLRQQGYQPPAAADTALDPKATPSANPAVTPTDSTPILKIDLPQEPAPLEKRDPNADRPQP